MGKEEADRSLPSIRLAIDQIDRQIVALLAERELYVKQATLHKNTLQQIRVPAREEEIIANVRRQSVALGINPDFIEPVFRTVIASSVDIATREFLDNNQDQ